MWINQGRQHFVSLRNLPWVVSNAGSHRCWHWPPTPVYEPQHWVPFVAFIFSTSICFLGQSASSFHAIKNVILLELVFLLFRLYCTSRALHWFFFLLDCILLGKLSMEKLLTPANIKSNQLKSAQAPAGLIARAGMQAERENSATFR